MKNRLCLVSLSVKPMVINSLVWSRLRNNRWSSKFLLSIRAGMRMKIRLTSGSVCRITSLTFCCASWSPTMKWWTSMWNSNLFIGYSIVMIAIRILWMLFAMEVVAIVSFMRILGMRWLITPNISTPWILINWRLRVSFVFTTLTMSNISNTWWYLSPSVTRTTKPSNAPSKPWKKSIRTTNQFKRVSTLPTDWNRGRWFLQKLSKITEIQF